MPIELAGIKQISGNGEEEVISIDYQDWLFPGELLTGTPTVTEVTTSDLTIDNEAVNDAATTIDGRAVAIGQAVQFSVSGQVAGSRYRIRITATSDAAVPRTAVRDIRLECV